MKALVVAALALAAADRSQFEVPEVFAQQVVGCWELRQDYRLVLRQEGAGLREHQTSGRRVVDEQVRYDPASQTLGFSALGHIHKALLMLRWNAGGLEYAFAARRSGRWSGGAWQRARRCSPE